MLSRYFLPIVRSWKARAKRGFPRSIAISRLPSTGRSEILLTFDDGPHPEETPAVLDLLEEHEARAVFFVVGKFVEKWPDQLKDVHDRGHLIGNHSFAHPNTTPPRYGDYLRDLERCQEVIAETVGERPVLFRPPLGRLTVSSIRAGRRHGLKTILWSIEGGEWGIHKSESASQIGKRLVAEVSATDVVLLHDNNTKVPEILHELLPALHARGFDLRSGVDTVLGKDVGDS